VTGIFIYVTNHIGLAARIGELVNLELRRYWLSAIRAYVQLQLSYM